MASKKKPTWDTLWPRFKPACAEVTKHDWHVRVRDKTCEPIAVKRVDGVEYGYADTWGDWGSAVYTTEEGQKVLLKVREVWRDWRAGS